MAIFRYLLGSLACGGFGMRQYYKSLEPNFSIKKSISLSKEDKSPEVALIIYYFINYDRLYL